MLSYDEFKDVVTEKIKLYLPEEYQEREVKVSELTKINTVFDGLSIGSCKNDSGTEITPVVYLNEIYDDYMNTGDLEFELRKAAASLTCVPNFNLDSILTEENIREKIFFQVLNTEQNLEFLSGVPHREFHDLSVVYRCLVSADNEGIKSFFISNNFAASYGVSEEELYRHAFENTRKFFPIMVRPIHDFIKDAFIMSEWGRDEVPDSEQLWVVSNTIGVNGANVLLYENTLHELAERVNDDLYILPFSVHAVLALTATGKDPESLAQMVEEVHMTQVDLHERLSNQVYHYDRTSREISLAAENVQKRLDGMDVVGKRSRSR